MISQNLQQAIDNLRIQDVYQRRNHSQCIEGFYPKDTDFSQLQTQQMHTVRRTELFDTEEGSHILLVIVVMGVRWVAIESTQQPLPLEGADSPAEPATKAFIEAEFVAEYHFNADLPDDCLDEFAKKNASFHVWPYWREFLMSQTERLRLPRLMLSTMQLPHHQLPENTST